MAQPIVNIEDFDSLYYFDTNYSYPNDVWQQIDTSRRRFSSEAHPEGKLLFDRLLDLFKINTRPKNSECSALL
jgi:hypothetical protein